MRSVVASFAGLLALVQSAAAQSMYDQCGGTGWKGSTSCPSGATCTYVNAYYSQCLPSAGGGGGGGGSCGTSTVYQTSTMYMTSTVTVSAPGGSVTVTDTITDTVTATVTASGTGTTTSSTSTSTPTGTGPPGLTCEGASSQFTYTGVSSSGAEFGTGIYPGQLNKDYVFPNNDSLDWFFGQGMNFIRLPFALERLIPITDAGLNGDFNQTYLGYIQDTVNHITGKGAYVAIDPHNYMRYNGSIITDVSSFSGFWYVLALQFANNPNVIFDLQNEPYGIDATDVFALEQAAIYAIRQAGATSQLILLEGTSWTGAWTWTSSGNAAAFQTISDPNNNFAIEMHQYLDSDGSGTNATCMSPAIGAQRLADATLWLQENNYKGFLGEIGAGNNDVCTEAVYVAFCSMQQSGVWLGFSWWAAGPWWGDYFTSIEPSSGPILGEVYPYAIQPFIPTSESTRKAAKSA